MATTIKLLTNQRTLIQIEINYFLLDKKYIIHIPTVIIVSTNELMTKSARDRLNINIFVGLCSSLVIIIEIIISVLPLV